MKKFFSGSFVRTAVFFIIITALPALGIVVFAGMERSRHIAHDAEAGALSVVRSVAQAQKTIAAGADTILSTLAGADDFDCAGSSMLGYLLRMRNEHPAISEIFIASGSGEAISTRLDDGASAHAGDRLYFSRSLSGDGLVAGETVVSRIDGLPTYNFAHRLTCRDGSDAALIASLSLDYYQRVLRPRSDLRGGTLYLADEFGVSLFSYPEQGALAPVPEAVLDLVRSAKEPQGISYLETESGREMVAFEKLFLSKDAAEPYMLVVLALPTAPFAAEAASAVLADVLALLLAFAVTVVLCVLLIRAMVMPPLNKMLSAARHYGKGEYSTRAELGGSFSELAELGHSMNAMAESLDKRERDLIAARETAEAAGKTKSEFLANMSHEVRTPMNAIIGMAYLSLKGELSQQQRGYITRIHEAGSNLLRIINDILELSRLDAGKLTVEKLPFDLRDLLIDLRGKYLSQAEEKGLEFVLDIAPDVPGHVVGDPLRLEQVLVNLIDNALRFTVRGSISISCILQQRETSGVAVQLRVADTGSGMNEAQIEALTKIFKGESEALPESFSGSSGKGFGLVLANRLLQLMGGSMAVDSKPGQGTVFTVSLGFEMRSRMRGRGTDILRDVRLLIVDSDADDLGSLEGLLSSFGVQVTIETRPRDAFTRLGRAEAEGHPYSLIILPWRMPGQDGVEMTRHIKEDLGLAQVPRIIMLSAYSWAGIASLADQAGVDAFLHKPVNESVLLDTIMNLLQVQPATPQGAAPGDGTPGAELPEGMRVLLVEDNAVNQQIAKEILEDAGMRVELAENGEEALRLLDPAQPEAPYDLVLMDLQMPVLDGFEATRRLRAGTAAWAGDLPVIAMTAHSRDEEFVSVKDAGLNDYAAKPIAVDDLFATLNRWAPLRPVEDAAMAATLRDIYKRLSAEDFSVLSDIVEYKDVLEGALFQGRAVRLLEMAHAGKLKEAAAFLERADAALHFMQEGQA